MTRSLGDFYLQHFGVSWEPAVRCIDTSRPLPTAVAASPPHAVTASTTYGCSLHHLRLQVSCIDLFDVAGQLSQVTLVVASDGLWDLWQYKDVLQYSLGKPPPTGTAEVFAPLGALVEETRKQGEELFGEQADNITAIVVCCDIKPQ